MIRIILAQESADSGSTDAARAERLARKNQ